MRVLMLGWDFSPRLSGGVGSACQGLAEALTRAGAPLAAEVLFVLPRLRGDEEPGNVRLLASDAVADPRASAARGPASSARLAPRPEPVRALRASLPAAPLGAPTGPAASESRAPTRAEEPAPARPVQPEAEAELEPRLEAAPRPAPASAPPPTMPTLPTPAEALELLSIDSPLRPYLSPAGYDGLVRELFARLRAPITAPIPAPAVRPRTRAGTATPASSGARTSSARVRATPQLPTPSPQLTPREIQRAVDPAPAPEVALAPEPAPRPDLERVPVPPYGGTLDAEVERYARAVLALVQPESFDVIHAHDWMTFPAGLLLRERTGKPLVVHFHSCEAERRGAQALPEVRAIEQAAIDAAERVLCVSEASARTLRAQYALEFAKLRVLHNAYAPLLERTPAGERGESVVLYLGRLSEQKGPDVFLRACAAVAARHARARFVLAGEGELYPELVELARELELESRVEFTGFVSGPELARTFSDADVYVLSSAAEPFGISALEALSLGVPTIVPRDAGVGEVVRSVLRFPSGDVAALADKIVALLERPALRAELSAAGLREVKKLRWDRPARALSGIYAEVTRGAP